MKLRKITATAAVVAATLVPLAPAAHADVLDDIAQKESNGNPTTNTGNGFAGAFQFVQSSWEAAGGTAYAPTPLGASYEQQKAVAARLIEMQGVENAFPLTAQKLGLSGTAGVEAPTAPVEAPAPAPAPEPVYVEPVAPAPVYVEPVAPEPAPEPVPVYVEPVAPAPEPEAVIPETVPVEVAPEPVAEPEPEAEAPAEPEAEEAPAPVEEAPTPEAEPTEAAEPAAEEQAEPSHESHAGMAITVTVLALAAGAGTIITFGVRGPRA